MGFPLSRPPAVLSKEEVEAEKATMRAIDARPIKKVAEARQRKRKRLQVHCSPGCMACISSRDSNTPNGHYRARHYCRSVVRHDQLNPLHRPCRRFLIDANDAAV